MALINKIRQRAGLAVGIVAVAMGLFIVGTDLFNSNSAILGKNDRTIGEIAGEEINYDEFQNELEKLKYQFQMRNQGNPPSENEMFTLRQQAWEMLIIKHVFAEQYEKLGIKVSDEESWDMVQGDNVDPSIKNDPSFQDPETGEFDKQRVIEFIKQINQMPAGNFYRESWILFEEGLTPARRRLKYDNLLVKSTYVTEAEAEKQYEEETAVAEAEYLYIPFYTVENSEITVDESDLRAYYREHKEEYETEPSRDISYVTVDIVPSSEDSAYFQQEMGRIKEQFKTASNDSVFARSESDTRNFYDRYTINQLPDILQKNHTNLTPGDVRGPYYVDGYFTLYKISDIVEDTVQAAKASHILVKWEDESDAAKEEARNEAHALLRQLQGGADFETLARENSQDPGSASKGGSLGWFGKGRMVKPFEEAVFSASREGLINRLVESQFGYHIIRVDEVPTNKAFEVATVEREITPSDVTRNEAYRQIDLFASSSSNYDEFVENAEADSLEIQTAENNGPNDRRISDLGGARQIIQWMYQDASLGDVSQVFELEDQYVVAVLTGITEKGTASFEEVKDQIRPVVENKKKGEIIKNKLAEMNGSLQELADQYGDDANVYNSSDIKLSTSSLPSVGFAPEVIGKIFGMEEGATSEPIEVENGVVVVKLQAKTPAPEIADHTSYQTQLQQRYANRASYNVSEAIREAADIKDYRYRFF